MAAAGAGGYLAASYYQDVRACDEGTFQYGRNCRKCSAWTCPTGQYRGSCSQHADSWCKLCTNKPEGDYIYTSPGNDNDCAFEPCSTDSASTTQPLCAGVQVPAIDSWSSESPADLVFYMEMPLDQSMFNALGATYKDTLSELTGGAAVSIGAVEAISTEVFTRTKMARVLDSGAQQRREGNLPCAPLPSECELDDSTECLKVLVVETTVTTTLGNVDDTWSKLNEFDLNAIFRAKCLPPVVIKYAEFADSDDKQLDTVEITLIAVGAVISIVSCIAISFFFIRRHRMQKPAAEGNLSGVELPPQALMSVVGECCVVVCDRYIRGCLGAHSFCSQMHIVHAICLHKQLIRAMTPHCNPSRMFCVPSCVHCQIQDSRSAPPRQEVAANHAALADASAACRFR